MKLLLLILLLVGCNPKTVENCVTNNKCKVEVPEKYEDLPEEETVGPTMPPEVSKPYYYNHSLYLKSFSFWGLNFVSDDLINKNKYNVFTSTNTIQTTVGTQFKTVFAKIFFKLDEKVKINYYNHNTHALELSYERDWVIYDDMEFHIDGYKQGEFAWHSKIIPTIKTDIEIDNGVKMYERTDSIFVDRKCQYTILLEFVCTDLYKTVIVYTRYYFD